MKIYLSLFYLFAKIGLFTFGGGYAMIPILERELVDKRNLCTSEELSDYYAIGQCTPGIISVNVATFVGYKCKKIKGALAATAGIISPSIIIITIIASFFVRFSDSELLAHALGGVRVTVCALVAVAVLRLAQKGVKDAVGGIVFALTVILMIIFNVTPPLIVAAAAIVGISIQLLKVKAGKS